MVSSCGGECVGWTWGQYLKLQPGMGTAGYQHRAGTISHAPCPGSCLDQEQARGLETSRSAQQHPGIQAASDSSCRLAGYLQRCWDRVTFRGWEPLLSLDISSHNGAMVSRLGVGQLGPWRAHTTLVLSPCGAHTGLCAAAAPWAGSLRVLGCRGQPAPSAMSCGKAVPALGQHTLFGLGRTRSLQATPCGQPATALTSAHTHTFMQRTHTRTWSSKCGRDMASARLAQRSTHGGMQAHMHTQDSQCSSKMHQLCAACPAQGENTHPYSHAHRFTHINTYMQMHKHTNMHTPLYATTPICKCRARH